MVGIAPSSNSSTTIPTYVIPIKIVVTSRRTQYTYDPSHVLSNGKTVTNNTVTSPIFNTTCRAESMSARRSTLTFISAPTSGGQLELRWISLRAERVYLQPAGPGDSALLRSACEYIGKRLVQPSKANPSACARTAASRRASLLNAREQEGSRCDCKIRRLFLFQRYRKLRGIRL
jgi:hypothetical protein